MSGKNLKKGDVVVLVEGALDYDVFTGYNFMEYGVEYTITASTHEGYWIELKTPEGKSLPHSCYGSSFELANKPKITYKDLIGKCIKRTNNGKIAKIDLITSSRAEFTWVYSGNSQIKPTHELLLRVNSEEFEVIEPVKVEEHDRNSVSAESIAKRLYEDYTNGGWSKEDFEVLHDKTVKEWLINNNLSQREAHRIRQLVQNMSKDDNKPGIRSYSRSELLYVIIKDRQGINRKFEPGYNSTVLRAVSLSNATNVRVFTISYINRAIKEGTWEILQGTPMDSGMLIHEGNVDLKITGDVVVQGAIDMQFNPNAKSTWQRYDANTEVYSTEPEENEIVGFTINDNYVKIPTKGNLVSVTIEDENGKHFYDFNDNNSTKQEEQPMKKLTNEIAIEVPMAAYAETTTISSYGQEVRVDDEEALTSLIVRIDEEQAALKDLNKNAKSSRIKGQINKLGLARTKITELLDALPDE